MVLALLIILGASAYLIKADLSDSPRQNRHKQQGLPDKR